MIHNLNNFVNESLGSSLTFSAHGRWGKEKNLSAEKSVRPKSFGGEAQAGGQKGRGLGEGIFARLLPVPVPFEQRKSGRGFGGIPLFLCEIKMRPVPPPLQYIARQTPQKNTLFIRRKRNPARGKMKRAKSIFLWCGELVERWRGWLP